jgi:hypothetical protein
MIGKNCEKCSPCIWVRRSQKASAELEAHSHVVSCASEPAADCATTGRFSRAKPPELRGILCENEGNSRPVILKAAVGWRPLLLRRRWNSSSQVPR